MRSRSGPNALGSLAVPAVLLGAITVFLTSLAACAPLRSEEGRLLEPSPGSPADSRLGPGVRPLSAGPGDKAAPRPSPTGTGVAFFLDGRPAEKPSAALQVEVVPGEGPTAGLEWVGGDALAFLSPEDGESGPHSLSIFREGERPVRVADNVADLASGAGGVLAAVDAAPEGSEEPAFRLVFVGPGDPLPRLLPGALPGRVTGLSVAPDGLRAVLVIERDGRSEIWVQRLSSGALRRLTRLPEGVEVLGDPQLTPQGAYFVAGEANGGGRDGEPAPYALYQVRRAVGAAPEPVKGVGEDFVAAAVRVSPDGKSRAVLGRRSPGAPVELYVLDLDSGNLRTVTRNEDMEIKTGPDDLSWTPDGRAVVLVARGSLSGPETYNGPASALHAAFFNLYEVPAFRTGAEGPGTT